MPTENKEVILALAGEPVGAIAKGKLQWNTNGGPEAWRKRKDYEGDLFTANQLTAARKPLEEEVERLERLAYVGEHQFEDSTWKSRCTELRQQLAAQSAEWHKAYELAMLAQYRADKAVTALKAVLEAVVPYRENGEPSMPDAVSIIAAEALSIKSDTSALEAMITKAGEVMRERAAKEAIAYGCAGRSIQDTEQAIRSLPDVKLEDLHLDPTGKKG